MKCNTPVNPETKTALEGEALALALKDPSAPRCGQELTPDDIFCPSCGARVEDASQPPPDLPPILKKFYGRSSRKEFWIVALKIALWTSVADIIVLFVLSGVLGSEGVALMLSLIIVVAGIVGLPVSARRLHDLGHSGWLLLVPAVFAFVCVVCNACGAGPALLVVPLACQLGFGLFLFIETGFAKGTNGPNSYGPDPLSAK